jgi:uncharacterized phage-associated protein
LILSSQKRQVFIGLINGIEAFFNTYGMIINIRGVNNMRVSVFTAAKHLCEKSKGSLTDLELYRLLYVAQMTHLGVHDRVLFAEEFEAWEFGPVQPDLYHQINTNGESQLKKILDSAPGMLPGTLQSILDQTYQQACQLDDEWFIAVTRWSQGAWAKTYDPAKPHQIISKELIKQEYFDRLAAIAPKGTLKTG